MTGNLSYNSKMWSWTSEERSCYNHILLCLLIKRSWVRQWHANKWCNCVSIWDHGCTSHSYGVRHLAYQRSPGNHLWHNWDSCGSMCPVPAVGTLKWFLKVPSSVHGVIVTQQVTLPQNSYRKVTVCVERLLFMFLWVPTRLFGFLPSSKNIQIS